MDIKAIMEYIVFFDEIESTTIKEKFNLSYKEVREIINLLLERKMLKYKSGVTYTVDKSASIELYPPIKIESQEQEYILRALWLCIVSNEVSVSNIQDKLSVDYLEAASILQELEEFNYVCEGAEQPVLITRDEYIEKFGMQEWVRNNLDGSISNGDRVRDIEELIPRVASKRSGEDDDSIDLKSILLSAFTESIGDKNETEKIVWDEEGMPGFLMKLINEGKQLQISDCGRTMTTIGKSQCKVKNALKKFMGVKLVGDEITIAVNEQYHTLISLMRLYAAIEYVKRI